MTQVNLYGLNDMGWFNGEVTETNDDAGYLYGVGGWVPVAPPPLQDGENAVWYGDRWLVTDQPIPVPTLSEPTVAQTIETAVPGETPTVI